MFPGYKNCQVVKNRLLPVMTYMTLMTFITLLTILPAFCILQQITNNTAAGIHIILSRSKP